MARQKPLADIGDRIPALAKRPDSVAEGKRDRSWDEANRAFSFRIREVDAERLAKQAQALEVSKDALTRALLELALDAVDAGLVAFDIDEQTRKITDRLGRVRVTTRRFVLAAWTSERNDNTGD